jgi:hypothetical protein
MAGALQSSPCPVAASARAPAMVAGAHLALEQLDRREQLGQVLDHLGQLGFLDTPHVDNMLYDDLNSFAL